MTALANDYTGLASADVFYFGNAIGDTGNSAGDTAVNVSDMLAVRSNFRTLANPAPVTFAYDFNRDQQVNTNDMLIARDNTTTMANMLQLFTAPASGSQGALIAPSYSVQGPVTTSQTTLSAAVPAGPITSDPARGVASPRYALIWPPRNVPSAAGPVGPQLPAPMRAAAEEPAAKRLTFAQDSLLKSTMVDVLGLAKPRLALDLAVLK